MADLCCVDNHPYRGKFSLCVSSQYFRTETFRSLCADSGILFGIKFLLNSTESELFVIFPCMPRIIYSSRIEIICMDPAILLEGLTTTFFFLKLDSLDLCSLPSFGNLISHHSWS